MTAYGLHPATQRLLADFAFDARMFETLKDQFCSGTLTPDSHRLGPNVAPLDSSHISPLPEPQSPTWRILEKRGRAAIQQGQVAAVILAGGMATRFDSKVKAAVEVLKGHRFLDLKLRDIRLQAARCGGPIPVFIMTSFATDAAVRALLPDDGPAPGHGGARGPEKSQGPEETFAQSVLLRLDDQGALFRTHEGDASPYAPGHGDLLLVLKRSGFLERFANKGGRYLYISNVDNLTATMDPAVLAAHLDLGQPVGLEVTETKPGDRGGSPWCVDGKPQIVEAFRLPSSSRTHLFNTNSLMLSVEAALAPPPLSWFAVEKQIDGRRAIQFERLVGEVSAFLPCHFLKVPRTGPKGRFLPVKDPETLQNQRAEIRAALETRGIL